MQRMPYCMWQLIICQESLYQSQCSQASLQTLTLPAYAPDLHSGAASLLVSTVMHQCSPQHGKLLWLTCLSVISQPTLPCPPQACLTGMQSNELAEIGLDSGQTVRARLVVGADGSRSRGRELAGPPHRSWQPANPEAQCCLPPALQLAAPALMRNIIKLGGV